MLCIWFVLHLRINALILLAAYILNGKNEVCVLYECQTVQIICTSNQQMYIMHIKHELLNTLINLKGVEA